MKMPSGYVTIIHENKTSVELEQKELITCKDCKHCMIFSVFETKWHVCVRDDGGIDMNADDYCSKAERKEE